MNYEALTAKFCKEVAKPGRYGDGRRGFGLALNVHETKAGDITKSWTQRVQVAGKPTNVGLGWYGCGPGEIGLAQAREIAHDNAQRAREGLPVHKHGRQAQRPAEHVSQPVATTGGPTFSECLDGFMALHAGEWSAGVERDRRNSMAKYVLPSLGKMPVRVVSGCDVISVLTAEGMLPSVFHKLRSRIREVLAYAVSNGHAATNAAEGIDAALPKVKRTQGSHPAPAPAEAPTEWKRIEHYVYEASDYSSLTLWGMFVVLTACRPTEARLAEWGEIDMSAKTWTIPAERTKTKREHRVALSSHAMTVLRIARDRKTGEHVFANPKTAKPYSNAASESLRKRAGAEWSLHGFARRTFSTWAHESGFDTLAIERALNHVDGNAIRGTYDFGDRLEARYPIMEAWGDHLQDG